MTSCGWSPPAPASDTGAPLTAAALGLSKPTRLTRALRDDPHLGPFLRIPSKDNGLDIEGLAVVGERIYLGLGGLGVRDMAAHGDDLLLLTGPTMDLDGPVRVYVWRGAAQAETSVVVHDKEIEKILDIPYGDGLDHAEGISLMPDPAGSGQDALLVIHDSPAPARRRHRHEILADIVPLPPAGG